MNKGLKFLLTVHPSVPTSVVSDPARLRQILINLVGNALKFTEQGEIVVEVRKETESDNCTMLHFSVRDTGIGIPLEKQRANFRCIFPGGSINHAQVWRYRTWTCHFT